MHWSVVVLAGVLAVAGPAPAGRLYVRSVRFRLGRVHKVVLGVVACGTVWLAGLQMAVVAAGMLAITLWAIADNRRKVQRHWVEKARQADAVRGIAAQVRAGVPARQAVVDYAADIPEVAAVAGLPVDEDTRPGSRLARLWQATGYFGLQVAPVLDAHARDVATQVRARGELKALLAGPQSTAVILTLLPLAGIGLGTSMGADPLGLLLHSGVGNILLLVGVALLCAGMVWSNHIMASIGGSR